MMFLCECVKEIVIKKILATLIFSSAAVWGMSANEMNHLKQMRLQRFEQGNFDRSGVALQQTQESKRPVLGNETLLDTSLIDISSLMNMTFESGNFLQLKEVTELVLDVRPFSEVKSVLYNVHGFDCPKMRKLQIIMPENPSREELQIAVGTYRSAKNLEELDVSGNNMDVMFMARFFQPASLGSRSVKAMNFQNNKIKSVPKWMNACPNLEVLNLNYNNGDDEGISGDNRRIVTDIISALGNFPKLRELRIVGMNLDKNIDQMWNLPQNLKLIEMDAKWLKCIPENKIESVSYSSDGKSVTVHLK